LRVMDQAPCVPRMDVVRIRYLSRNFISL
jgi:hypothetical protein